LLTGVPAEVVDVMGFMSDRGCGAWSALPEILSCGKGGKGRRRKGYKFLDECPTPARELVGAFD